jgi:RNA methyltransferase, TrmH family
VTVSLEHVAALRTRRARDETGRYFAEGVRFLVAAVDAAAPIEATVVVPALLKSAIGQLLVRRLRQRGIPELRVDRETFARLSSARDPQGVGVVLRQHLDPLRRVPMEHGACWLALESVQSPGNLGTLMRTSEAAGGSGVIALGPSVDPFDPNTVRATMGALFTRRLARASPTELSAWARAQGAIVIGASGDASTDYRAVRYDRPVVLVLGGERRGLSPHARGACDAVVRIPMAGRTDSLNLAVAGSILLYEVWSQRHPPRR